MEIIPHSTPGEILLLVAPRLALREALPPWMARLAAGGPLRVLDGGNCFDVLRIARSLRRSTPHVQDALKRITLARAFTCYQVAALLSETPGSSTPTLLLEPLLTFSDESVNLADRRRLLEDCIQHLKRLSQGGAATVSISLECTEDEPWMEMLEQAAGHIWRIEPPALLPPPQLF
jgi:hypothetical protein